MKFIKALGPFRLFLIISAIALMLCAISATIWLESELEADKLTLYVASAMVPIIFFLLLFDMLMNRVQIADKDEAEKNNYRCFIRLEAFVVLLLVASWTPFFMALLN